MSRVVLEDLRVRYPREEGLAVKGVHLKIDEEFVLILGRSGSGKSTLGKVISGVIPHVERAEVEGRVEVLGADPAKEHPPSLSRKVTYVAQSPYDQIFSETVLDEVLFVLENIDVKDLDIGKKCLKLVGLEGSENRRSEELSGGQLQKLAVACALALGSEVIILDEPLAHLEPRSSKELMKVLTELRSMGKTVILIEHRLREVIPFHSLIDRVIILDRGMVVSTVHGRELHKKVLLLANLGIRLPANFRASILLKQEMRSPMDLSPLEKVLLSADPVRTDISDGDMILKVDRVWASYVGRRYVLKDISLELSSGRVYVVMGPNASGKTTLLRVISGFLRPKRGKIIALGRIIRSVSDSSGLMGYVPQNADLVLMFETVRKELEERAVRNRCPYNVNNLAKKLLVSDLMDKNPHSLSRGQRFRVALAASLALNPKILLLDEPTTGQDEECIEALGGVLREFVSSGGTAVVTTHDPDFAFNYADSCIVIKDGEVRSQGSPGDVLSEDDLVLELNLAKPMVLSTCQKLGLPPITELELFGSVIPDEDTAEPSS